jgi:copper chaperone CopZ
LRRKAGSTKASVTISTDEGVAMSEMTEHRYAITGMTCDNCRRHVTEALAALPGVSAVAIDLQAGTATVRADRDLSDKEVGDALDEAGYQLA